ncbi:glycoside hydrolase family protein [Massilia sp. 9096]|uniref:glycoside hydrolase family protein n=1 Tax=Massilia sp. 9096 TaxID=1500894 RepID=UPI001EFA5E58|nr:glycoside hydrolase family protein [Massilia sp. 9096]
MPAAINSPSGRVLHHRATRTTTPREDAEAKVVRIKLSKERRLAENRKYLQNPNIYAFLKAIAEAEGGGYDFKYGAVKGKKNDPWRFTDYSTHPGPGFGGKTTAAGMYQENIDTWREMGGNMGLTDFTPETQDLIAIEILRVIKAIDSIQSGDINAALSKASRRWSSLPQGKGKSGYYPNQPSVSFDAFESNYKRLGGISND